MSENLLFHIFHMAHTAIKNLSFQCILVILCLFCSKTQLLHAINIYRTGIRFIHSYWQLLCILIQMAALHQRDLWIKEDCITIRSWWYTGLLTGNALTKSLMREWSQLRLIKPISLTLCHNLHLPWYLRKRKLLFKLKKNKREGNPSWFIHTIMFHFAFTVQ